MASIRLRPPAPTLIPGVILFLILFLAKLVFILVWIEISFLYLFPNYSNFKITNEVMADSSHIPTNVSITYICSFCTEKKTNVIGKWYPVLQDTITQYMPTVTNSIFLLPLLQFAIFSLLLGTLLTPATLDLEFHRFVLPSERVYPP